MLYKHCSATPKSGDNIIWRVLVTNLKHNSIEDAMKKAHSIPLRLIIAGSVAHTKVRDTCLTGVALSG